MILVIAEKPSVAMSIGKVMGATSKKDGYTEGNGYIISWCVGHLVGLAPTESYDERYSKWSLDDLPIMPSEFKYMVSKGKEKQLKVLSSLLNRKDVEYVVNACDAGREGELIFRLVYNLSKSTKPMKRLWISSMEDSAIKQGFDNLKDGNDFDLLYKAATLRQQADWLVGINGTRLFSCLYNQQLNVGRVMSPTLAMIVQRNAEINAFKSEPFYNVILTANNVAFTSVKFKDKTQADDVLKACENQPIIITAVENKEKAEKPPKLYDLTTLQREVNRKLGFTANQTLEYTQSLYEKKLCTYPRTDSKFLTDDMEHTLADVVAITMDKLQINATAPTNTRLVIDNSKVTDHHAIIPTKTLNGFDINNLPHGEKEVLTLIMLRLLSALGDSFKYSETVISAKCGDVELGTKGKTILEQGFKVFDLKADNKQEETPLPLMAEGEVLDISSSEIKVGKTSPPKQFTEDTILSAMENAGRDEDVEKEFCGIGTPATRAGVLEKLVNIKLLERKGDKKTKYLVPTDKGTALITILPESIASPLTTATWEEKLKCIEFDEISPDEFLSEIKCMVKTLVGTYEMAKGSDALFPRDNIGKVIGTCPRCGADVTENKKGYACSSKDCAFALWKENKFFTSKKTTFTEKMAKDLLTTGKTKLTGCYSEKTGKKYDCTILLDDTGGKYVNFKMEFGKK
ncbi:MAG: DNA topoisomerase 3 [Brevinema sp.]